jgi:large-conductance mechanosensitive channel
MDALEWGKPVVRILRFVIIATFIAVLISTLTECQPLSL